MSRVLLLFAALVGGAALIALGQPEGEPVAPAQAARQPDLQDDGPRFAFVDVFIDSGETPLAVYQVELRATSGDIRIVGVEGGDHAAFAAPPRYDPRALQNGERIVLGAFSAAPDLPAGDSRVARVHLRIDGPDPRLDLSLTAAGDALADEINAKTSFKIGSRS